MTVSNTDSPVKIYTGTATEYPIPFDYISDNDILVTLYNTTTGAATDQTIDVDYTISDKTVIYSEAPGSVYNVVIRRVTPYTQEASFGPGEEPPLSTYESCFDKLTMLAQDLNERLERCIMFPDSYSGTDFELPNPTGNAGKLIRINEDGTGLDVLAVTESGQATEVTEYCNTGDLEKIHTSRFASYGSVSSMVNAIGSTRKHLVCDTDVTLTEDTIFPATMSITIENGGSITLGDHNLIINGPFTGSPGCFVARGSGVVSFGSGAVEAVPVTWFGAAGDGSTDDAAAFTHAIAACPTGGRVYIPGTASYYKLASAVTINKALTVYGDGDTSEIRQATSNTGGLVITASDVTIRDIKLYGPQHETRRNGEKAVYAYGADAAHYITGLKIRDVIIENWGMYAIYPQFVKDFDFSHNTIKNINYGGILMMSCVDGVVSGNHIDNIIGGNSPLSYGIEMTRVEHDSLVTHPRCSRITVFGNTIRNMPNWRAIGSHGGEDISITGNEIYACQGGIQIGGCNNGSGIPTFPPLNISIVGNVMNSGVTDGSAGNGIFFVGTNEAYGTGVIAGNVIEGYGNDDSTIGAVYICRTDGLAVSGNSILRSVRAGILVSQNNRGLSITGNTIHDVWSDSLSVPYGIIVDGASTSVFIDANSISAGSYAADSTHTYDLADGAAIRIGDHSDCYVHVGANNIEGVQYALLDLGGKAAKTRIIDVSTSGTGEDDLHSMTIQAASIGRYGGIRVTAAGTKTGSGGDKTVKFYFGTKAITFHAAANNTNDWRFVAEVFNVQTNYQRITWVGYDGATVLQGYDTSYIDTTADVVVRIAGECAHADDVINQTMMLIERL